jgi:hypothetical protein
MDCNDSEGNEMSNFELKRVMIRLTNEVKECMHKYIKKIKENTKITAKQIQRVCKYKTK